MASAAISATGVTLFAIGGDCLSALTSLLMPTLLVGLEPRLVGAGVEPESY